MLGRPVALLLAGLTVSPAAAAQSVFVPDGHGFGPSVHGGPLVPAPPGVYGQGAGVAPPQGRRPSLVGTWNGQTDDGSRLANHFEADGRFTVALQSANGLRTRMWGHYTLSADRSGKVRLDLRYEGWLPKRSCREPLGGARECTPTEFDQETDLLSFPAPDTLSIDEASDNSPPIVLRRDGDPTVLNAPVPEQYVDTSPDVPVVLPYGSPSRRRDRSYDTAACEGDTQQRAICGINDGRLVHDHYGCLKCIGRNDESGEE